MQAVIGSIVFAAWYAPAAVALGLGIRARGFIDVSVASAAVLGAYTALFLRSTFEVTVVVAGIGGVLFAAAAGLLLESALYSPLRRAGASSLVLLLASFGAYVAIENLISLSAGDNVRLLRDLSVAPGLQILGARVSQTQIFSVGLSMAALGLLVLGLHWSRVGLLVRAVASDAELASVSGIDVPALRKVVATVGAGLLGLTGILVGVDIDLLPSMGIDIFMMAIVVAILGGRSMVGGHTLAALSLGLLLHFTLWRIGSEWDEVLAFLILLVALVLKPRGLFEKTHEQTA